MSDSQVKAEANLHTARAQAQRQAQDFWDRTAQAGRTIDQTHQQTQKETQAEENKPRQMQP
jgi:hypothetical protein